MTIFHHKVNYSKIMNTYAVTGTFHGSIIEAKSEGEARRLFHEYYNGESILYCFLRDRKYFKKLAGYIQ